MSENHTRTPDLSSPVVMGILNITPDSFYDGGWYGSIDEQLKQTEKMIRDGAGIIDIGAVSTRPGAKEICEVTEVERLYSSLKAVRHNFPDVLISIDTYRSNVARIAVEMGADIINDIYGGLFDEEMPATIARLNVPYIMMHMKGNPMTMQENPVYGDVVGEISYFFDAQAKKLNELGFHKIILDPGFGFGKTVAHNFEILARLGEFRSLGYPVMAGLSRKSMVNRPLGILPAEALNGTTVLNTIALLKGASILRVHDVKEAVEAVKLVKMVNEAENP
jgi:dihydropteroate synthase